MLFYLDEQQNTALLLQAALQEEEDDLLFARPTSQRAQQTTDALESLLATAALGEPEIEEPAPVQIPEARPVAQERPRTAGRTRRPPGIPRRRPRPRPVEDEEDRGARRPNRPAENTVNTVERYSHMNEDGSFTFGYMAEDGSFREETRGVDCITRGKYGYIDPEGKRREFTYVSGLPCDIGEEPLEGEDGELQTVNEDPIDPAERFRTAAAVQLSEDEIPAARQRQRQQVRNRPQAPEARPQAVIPNAIPTNARPTRIRDPAVAQRRPRPQPATGSALENLLNIAEDAQPAIAPTPIPRRPVSRPRPRPTSAPASFDFDEELDGFTLNRPAITFDEAARQGNRPTAAAPTPVGPNFSSELVFNPETGTFQTELRQQIRGEGEVRVSNSNAPAGRRPTPTPTAAPRPVTPTPTAARPRPPTPGTPRATFSATPIPGASPAPFTAFSSQPARPTPPQSQPGPIAFQPLSFPDPASVTPRPSSPAPSPTPSRPVPSPTVPVAPATPTPSRPPTPTAAPVRPASPSPANSFFFTPFPTVGSPRPVAPGQPATPTPFTPRQPSAPAQASVIPAGTFTLGRPAQPQPQPVRPAPPQPQAPRAQSVQARPPPPPRPQPQAARPVPSQPQIQFGFQPVQQQQNRPAPFTAFASGTPPQLRGVPGQPPRPQPVSGQPPRPQGFSQPPQAFRPQPQQLGVPPQLQSGARFTPFGRPPPNQGQQPFTVFNPTQFRTQG